VHEIKNAGRLPVFAFVAQLSFEQVAVSIPHAEWSLREDLSQEVWQ
jgi:hypothetical protein